MTKLYARSHINTNISGQYTIYTNYHALFNCVGTSTFIHVCLFQALVYWSPCDSVTMTTDSTRKPRPAVRKFPCLFCFLSFPFASVVTLASVVIFTTTFNSEPNIVYSCSYLLFNETGASQTNFKI